MTAYLMSALESCDEAKPMGPDIDKDPRITAVLCDPLAELLSSQLCFACGTVDETWVMQEQKELSFGIEWCTVSRFHLG